MNKKYIGVDEASSLLGVHRTTLIFWIKRYESIKRKNPDELTEADKKIRCPIYGRMGSRYRFTQEDIEKFIEESMNREGE